MLFTMQKVLWFLLLPPASLVVFMIFGVMISRNRRGLARGILFISALILYVLSLGPTANLLLRPLERSVHPLSGLPGGADAVVVPGGGAVDRSWIAMPPVPNGETCSRLVLGVELAKKMKIPLVLTGGNGEPFATRVNDAEVMAQAAYSMGMPRGQVVVEKSSRNTLENARSVRKLLKGKRIVLVTSAYYMGRAVTMFKKQGFTVIPAPTYYLAHSEKMGPALLIPRAEYLRKTSVALAEWLSLIWWNLRGEL